MPPRIFCATTKLLYPRSLRHCTACLLRRLPPCYAALLYLGSLCRLLAFLLFLIEPALNLHVSSRQPRSSMLACLFKHLQTPALNAMALPLGATAWKPPAAVEPGTLLPPAAACTGWRRLLRCGPATLLALHLGSGQRLELAASSIQRPARLCPCATGGCLSVSLQRRCALTRWDLQPGFELARGHCGGFCGGVQHAGLLLLWTLLSRGGEGGVDNSAPSAVLCTPVCVCWPAAPA